MFGFINPRRSRTPEENERVENLPGPLQAMDSEFNPNGEVRAPRDPGPGPGLPHPYRDGTPVVRNGQLTRMIQIGNTGRWRLGDEEISAEEAIELMNQTNEIRDRMGVSEAEELGNLEPEILREVARGRTPEQAETIVQGRASRANSIEQWRELNPEGQERSERQPAQQQPQPIESLRENVEDVQPTAAMQASRLEEAMDGGRYFEPEGTPQRIQANEPQAIVSHLQQALQSSGRDIEVDGRWGPETAAAMAEVARENRMVSPRADEQSIASGEIRTFIDRIMRGR